MSEETPSVSTEQPASTEAPVTQEPSLDDVYKTYNVEPSQPEQPKQQEPQKQEPQQPHIPDPALDYEGFKRYEASKLYESQTLRQQLSTVTTRLTQHEARMEMEKQNADIKQAVGLLKEKNPDHDDEFLEVALGTKARKDPKFQAAWDNRMKNPKAWSAVVSAYSNELAGKYTVKADPQLAENQRAMKTAQQSMATAQKESSQDEKLGKLQGRDFDRAMDRIRSGQSPF